MTTATTINGEGRMQRGRCVPANDFRDGCDDKEAGVACLSSESEDSFVTASEGLEERDILVLDCTAPLERQPKPDWIGNWGIHVEAAAEKTMRIESNMLRYVGPATCIEPPKRPTHTAGQAEPSNVMRFGSDQWGIANYRMSVEAAEEDELIIEKIIF